MLVDVQLDGLTNIRVVLKITLTTLYLSSPGKSAFPGSNILFEISDAASLFRCFAYSHVATPNCWARREVGWGSVSRPHDVGCNTPPCIEPLSSRLQGVTDVRVECVYWSNTIIFIGRI